MRRIAALIGASAALGSCSYSYDVIAEARGGQIVFAVDPASSKQPSCVRQVVIFSESERKTVWRENVEYDDACANRFPVAYGIRLNGRHQRASREVPPQSLKRDTVYEVSVTTGATGYGSTRFVIHGDGHVENLPRTAETLDAGNGR